MDLIAKALAANRETKQIEFKEGFDPSSTADWCELTKDFVALANSGGGVLVIGLLSDGGPSSRDMTACLGLDPAEIANRVGKYIGSTNPEFEVARTRKSGKEILVISVASADVPIVFEKPGTYEVADGKQKTAFGVGTLYFRRGARSAPGTSDEVRRAIDRRVEVMRRSWLSGLRRVVEAGPDSTIIAVPKASIGTGMGSVRAVSDASATPVFIVRGQPGTGATFVHEQLSGAIFNEINNVLGANRLLGSGKDVFVLGGGTYYRVYAERQHVARDEFNLLFRHACMELYAPFAYWCGGLREDQLIHALEVLFLQPRNPQVQAFMRLAILAGRGATDWLSAKFQAKWGRHPQPPRFVHAFRTMAKEAAENRRMAAMRMSSRYRFVVRGEEATVDALMQSPDAAANILSNACLAVFEGDKAMRTAARQLDLIAHIQHLERLLPDLFDAVIRRVGSKLPQDPIDSAAETEG